MVYESDHEAETSLWTEREMLQMIHFKDTARFDQAVQEAEGKYVHTYLGGHLEHKPATVEELGTTFWA